MTGRGGKIRAARLVAHEQPLAVEELELASPGEGEVVVDLAYGGVNPVDRYEVLGRVARDARLPRTLGSEAAGAVHDSERRVFCSRSALARPGDGLWASQALVQADRLIDVPEGVGLELAAAMGVAGTTAWRCVDELAQVTPEDRVLVLGASGGVGSIIVSICARLGADVVGQVGSDAKAAFVTARGANRVVAADAAGLASTLAGFRPTAVFDPLGGGFTGAAVEAMAERGRLVIFGTSADGNGSVPLQMLYRKGLRLLGYGGLIEPEESLAAGARSALEALASGRMEVVIDSIVPLGDVNDALDRLADRGVEGKLVLDLQA